MPDGGTRFFGKQQMNQLTVSCFHKITSNMIILYSPKLTGHLFPKQIVRKNKTMYGFIKKAIHFMCCYF